MLSAEQLQQRIREGIPLTRHMDFQVRELSANAITVAADGALNVNVHGTAFAGSLYTVCTLALWGLVNARLPEDAELVLAEGAIRYRRPVVGDIVAHCSLPPQQLQAFLQSLAEQGRARLQGTVEVPGTDGPAAQYSATVHARLGAKQHSG